MREKIMPIVFAIDENFVLEAAVAIHSLLVNGLQNRDNPIFILTNGRISEEGRNLFYILKRHYSDCMIKILTIDDTFFSNVKLKIQRITSASLYRLLLPDILIEYDNCIYLDADILVLKDISELTSIDISGMLLAGVIDKEVQKEKEHANEIGVPDLDGYINSGVMVMNLERLRKEGKRNEFLSLVNKGYRFGDQDILNKSCYGYIKRLPVEYNYFAIFTERKGDIRILHFAGSDYERPWLNVQATDTSIWWEYASLFEQSPIYKKKYQEMWWISESRSFQYILNYCQRYQSIYIWGYTHFGRRVLDGLIRNGVSQLAGFIDNDLDKQMNIYKGYKVNSSQIIDYSKNSLIINAAQKNRGNVNFILQEKGIKEENILQFYINSPAYFQTLDDSYFQNEFGGYLLKGIRD